VIVAGVGSMGPQTCWQLARRGQLGLDRYHIPNVMGSSHGEHRIIRLAYFEHPLCVPILRRAYELWRELEQRAGEQILFVTGSMDIGPEVSPVIEGALSSCREHHLHHEFLSADAVNRRYPGYALPQGYVAVYQMDGGFVAAERAVTSASKLAMDSGAVIRGHEPVLEVSPIAGGDVRVRTTRDTYEAGRLVMSPGAWVGELVPCLKEISVPERQVLGWFRPKKPELFRLGAFPVSNLKSDVGHF
jgi:sarcosine oxidase